MSFIDALLQLNQEKGFTLSSTNSTVSNQKRLRKAFSKVNPNHKKKKSAKKIKKNIPNNLKIQRATGRNSARIFRKPGAKQKNILYRSFKGKCEENSVEIHAEPKELNHGSSNLNEEPLQNVVSNYNISIDGSLKCEENFMDSGKEAEADEEKSDEKNLMQENLIFLFEKEAEYKPDFTNLLENKLEINWFNRAQIIDLLMNFGHSSLMKRTTVYTAINYIDRYISVVPALKRENLHLVGMTALFSASKLIEVIPKVHNFYRIEGVSFNNIESFEIKLLKALNFHLNPPTFCDWADCYMDQWDYFIQLNEKRSGDILKEKSIELKNNENFILFNKGKSKIHQELYEMLDCLIMDTETFSFDARAIVFCVMYLVLGKNYFEFDLNEMRHKLDENYFTISLKKSLFSQLFLDFISSYISNFNDLLPFFYYVRQFIGLRFLDEVKVINKKMIYEDVYRAQAYNPDCIQVIINRNSNL